MEKFRGKLKEIKDYAIDIIIISLAIILSIFALYLVSTFIVYAILGLIFGILVGYICDKIIAKFSNKNDDTNNIQ